MLRALESGKHRGMVLSGVEELSDRVNLLEDLLTAVVFGRINYFSNQAIARIACDLVPHLKLTEEDLGQLLEFRFWPVYELNRLSCTVEPDIVIEFDKCVFAIEAKRFDGLGMQSEVQLSKEYEALSNHFDQVGDGSAKDIYLVALGGHKRTVPANNTDDLLPWSAATWRQLWEVIAGLELDSLGAARVRDDILLAFKLHGVSVRDAVFFQSLAPAEIHSSSLAFPRIRSGRQQRVSVFQLKAAGLSSPLYLDGKRLHDHRSQ